VRPHVPGAQRVLIVGRALAAVPLITEGLRLLRQLLHDRQGAQVGFDQCSIGLHVLHIDAEPEVLGDAPDLLGGRCLDGQGSSSSRCFRKECTRSHRRPGRGWGRHGDVVPRPAEPPGGAGNVRVGKSEVRSRWNRRFPAGEMRVALTRKNLRNRPEGGRSTGVTRGYWAESDVPIGNAPPCLLSTQFEQTGKQEL
jgi:hypothetical protein